jgi:hypothetical protein
MRVFFQRLVLDFFVSGAPALAGVFLRFMGVFEGFWGKTGAGGWFLGGQLVVKSVAKVDSG